MNMCKRDSISSTNLNRKNPNNYNISANFRKLNECQSEFNNLLIGHRSGIILCRVKITKRRFSADHISSAVGGNFYKKLEKDVSAFQGETVVQHLEDNKLLCFDFCSE
jgi:hypothetical protein